MARNCCSRMILLFLTILIASSFLFAGSQYKGWSAEELTLAKKLGLDLSVKGGGFRWRPIGEQTWLSDWVVEGTVHGLEEDPYGVYHTKVLVHAERYLKGKGADEITLMLKDGPEYSQHYKGIVYVSLAHSVKFSKGDVDRRFLFFLNKGGYVPRGQEAAYQYRESEYHVLNRYLIKDEIAEPDSDVVGKDDHPGTRSYPYGQIVAEISRVAAPQSQLNGGKH